MSSPLGIIVIGRLLRAVFGLTWLILLHRWVPMVVVAFEINRSVTLFWVVIAIFTVTGPEAAPTLSFLLWPGGFILRCVLFVTIVFFRRIHHVDIV